MDYIEKANNVAILLNSKYKDLTDYRTTLVGDGTGASMDASQLADNVNKANGLLEDLVQINKQIVSSGTLNSAANNLYDQRDSILSELSNYLDITTKVDNNGVATVSLGDRELVRHTTLTAKFSMEANNTIEDDQRVTINLVDADGKLLKANINDQIQGGSIGAILDMGGKSDTDLTVQTAIDLLNNLAQGFAETLNSIQKQGWNADGTPDKNAKDFAMAISTDADGNMILAAPTEDLFVTNDGSNILTAGNISVNNILRTDSDKLAVAKVPSEDVDNDFTQITVDGNTFWTLTDKTNRKGVGNGKGMIDVLNTRNSTTNSKLSNLAPEDFLMSGISKIGIQADSIENQGTSQESIVKSIEDRLMSETSVDLNEELTDMIKYQRSYQASARVFNACCDILNTLVSLGA